MAANRQKKTTLAGGLETFKSERRWEPTSVLPTEAPLFCFEHFRRCRYEGLFASVNPRDSNSMTVLKRQSFRYPHYGGYKFVNISRK